MVEAEDDAKAEEDDEDDDSTSEPEGEGVHNFSIHEKKIIAMDSIFHNQFQ